MVKSARWFLSFQRRYALTIFISGIVLTYLAAPRAISLLTNIKTDLIHLLPDHYPSVYFSDEIKKKFDRRSSLFLILHSPDPEANKRAMMEARDYFKKIPGVGKVETEKKGFDFFERNKLLLIDLKDLYAIHDRLRDRIQKEKLGALYIDFEEDDPKTREVTFDDLINRYKQEFAEGVRSKYRTNKDQTVFVLNIYPESTDASLKFFKQFGDEIRKQAARFDFKRYHPEMTYGFAGAIITRVDQYDALTCDLKKAAVISGLSIFFLLYLYFGQFIERGRGFGAFVYSLFMQAVPVIAIFIPMIFSTLIAFWFSSFFIEQLNVVTSFLFAIIFGLGVDIGIHLITRYIQDRCAGARVGTIHRDIVLRTGKSCLIGILTTVVAFYVLTVNDFKGFSEFGWIAGNGLVVAFICYLVFFPCLLLLIDRFHLLRISRKSLDVEKLIRKRRRWIPYPKYLLALCAALTILSLVDLNRLHFEWDFKKLKLELKHREYWNDLLKQTYGGRVNSPAAYLIENEVQARKVGRIIRERREKDTDFDTIQFYRSYYDMVPFDQDEKMALLKKIDGMLQDDLVWKRADDDEKKLIRDFRREIAKTTPIERKAIPPPVKELFWGNTGGTETSVAYVMPLPHLELDNGNNARAFYDDVHEVDALGKKFYAISDSIIFAEVLKTLFKDSRLAIVLASLAILVLIALHFRNVKETLFILLALGCGIMWMLGIMATFDIRLNFYNMIIIPAMIGMGVDNSVHVVHRFEELKHRSIMAVLRTTGGAALMASLTTILGYSGMCYAHHPGLRSIGFMAIIGMGTCLVGSLFLLPLLLQLFLKPK